MTPDGEQLRGRANEPVTGTPETAALTGMTTPAAEAPPTVRGRRSAAGGGILLYFLAGVGLLICALLAPDESSTQAGTAVAGGIVFALGLFAVTGLFPPAVIAALGLVAAIALIVSGLVAEVRLLPDWARLAFGTGLLIAAAGSLAAMANASRIDEQPEPRVDAV
jgi:hypothetical protein